MTHEPRTLSAFRYLVIMLATAFILLGTVATVNIVIDPLGMYDSIKINGLNSHKPAIFNRMRLFKAFEVSRVKPQVLILGSSRSHVGLSCSHEGLAHLAGPCYNLAFDGATTKELYYYLRHAQSIRPLTHLVLGLDAYHATPAAAFTRADFDPTLLYGDGNPPWLKFIIGDLRLLTSLDTLKASIRTIGAQQHPLPSWFAPDGQRLGEVFFRKAEANFIQYGPRAYFDKIDRLEVESQIAGIASAAPLKSTHTTPQHPEESSLNYIRHIIEFCRAENIDLRIFMTPSHVQQLEIAAAIWGRKGIEDGKRALVKIISEDSAQHADKNTIPLIDFSGYSSVTTEGLPPVGSQKELQFYWDSSHFKQIAGDYVLDRLFDLSIHKAPADFGTRLTPQNIDTVVAQSRAEQMLYRKQHPETIAVLDALIKEQSTHHAIRLPVAQ